MKFLAGILAAASLVAAEEFRVIVGKNAAGEVANVFEPSQVTAKVGDVVHFEFRAKNHTVTQSSFAEPCTQQFNTVTQLPGVDSGFQFVDPAASEIPVWSIRVEQDQNPIWLFCARAPHCNAGMVFAINAPTEGERTFATFLEKAATANHPEYGTTADFTPPAPAAPPAGGDQQDPNAPPADPNAPPADPNAPPADPNAPPADPNAPPADPNAPPAEGAPSVPPIAATGTEVLVPVVPPTPGVVPPPAENAAPGTPDSAESANSGAFKVTGGVASGLFAVVAAAMLF